MGKEMTATDRDFRRSLLERLYRAYLEEGLYRGVIGKKYLSAEMEASNITLERNLEYLLDRGFIRMHKIEDLISITPDGIDWLEESVDAPAGRASETIQVLGRIEKLLEAILSRLERGEGE
ncbi:MAG: hypothetical protein U9P14_05600 [Gemmatimonadota bacterium]|nr:hypothetical protein [Gemmatimonadota bacterium]